MIANDEFQEILGLDLGPIKVKLMHADSGEGWSLSRVNGIEREYKRFLILMKKFPEEHTAPLVDVDTFWHYHILDTMKYAADCQHVFGYFLHHFPYIGMRGEEDEATLARMGERMGAVYEQTFGESYLQATAGLGQETAYCADASGRVTLAEAGDAAYCAAGAAAAYCAATAQAGGAEAAYCAATQAAAYCAATQEAGAVARSEAAYCAATQAPAYCATIRKAGATARAEAAYCAARPAAAYCAATLAPAYCASRPREGQLTPTGAAYCATIAQPGLTTGASYCAATAPTYGRSETGSDAIRVSAYCASNRASDGFPMSGQQVARLYSERPVLSAA